MNLLQKTEINKIKDAFKQIEKYNEIYFNDPIKNHLLIFPYRSGALHWTLGVIFVKVADQIFSDIDIKIKDSFGLYTEEACNWMEQSIKNETELIEVRVENLNCKRQQEDSSSSGAITAENAKFFLTIKYEEIHSNLLEQEYEIGAYSLRKQHMQEINSEDFNKTQYENKQQSQTVKKNTSKEEKQKVKEHINSLTQSKEYEHVKWLMQRLNEFEDENFYPLGIDAEVQKNNEELFKSALLQSTIGDVKLTNIIFNQNWDFHEDVYELLKNIIKEYNLKLVEKEKDEIEPPTIQLEKSQIQEITNLFKNDVKFESIANNFVDFIDSGGIYIDKSLFIKEVIDYDRHIMLTWPRRWGKSLNLSMLKTFLMTDGNDKGLYNENEKYDFSKENKYRKYFEGKLKIAKYEDIFNKYQGKYPVIYLSLKDVKQIQYNENELEELLRSVVSEWYK